MSATYRITLLILLGVWLLLFHGELFTPWIQGVDPVTRLLHIDDTLVVVLGNPWLPLLQLMMQGVHLFTDTPPAYKLVNGVIALGGMAVFFLLIAELLGYWAALFTSLFFFLHIQWIWVATSIYMEPLALLTLSSAAYLRLKKRTIAAALIFVTATFTRPEVLLALPSLCLADFLNHRNWKRCIPLVLLFVPVIAYYLWLKHNFRGFSTPGRFDLHVSWSLVRKLLVTAEYSGVSQGVLMLAALGVGVVLKDRDFPAKKRRALLAFAAALALFYAVFILITPMAHAFCKGGSRHSILLIMPAFVFAAIFVDTVRSLKPALMNALLLFAVALLIACRPLYFHEPVPPDYPVAQQILARLDDLGYRKDLPLYVCAVEPSRLRAEDVYTTHKESVLLYLRFGGRQLKEIPCLAGEDGWKTATSHRGPLLRIYDPKSLDPAYAAELTSGCRFFFRLQRKGAPVASLCL